MKLLSPGREGDGANAVRERYYCDQTPAGPTPTSRPAAMSVHAKSGQLLQWLRCAV